MADAKYIKDYLKANLDINDIQASAIVGNLIAESNLKTDINESEETKIVKGSRGGYGLAQWTGDRRKDLEKFAKQNNKPVSDLNTQLEFLVKELKTTEKKSLNIIKNEQTIDGASDLFFDKFMRGEKKFAHKDKRRQYSNDVFNLETEDEQQELESNIPSIQTIPRQETKAQQSPELESNVPAIDPNQFEQKPQEFDYNALIPRETGLVPIPSNVPNQPEGSLFAANFRQNTTIGSFIGSSSSRVLDKEIDRSLNFLSLVPNDLVNYADRFMGDKTPEQAEETANRIRQELNDKALIDAHPYKSFVYGIPQQMIDPVNFLPMGFLYKNAKRGTRLARSMISSSISGVVSATAQEAIIQQNQLAREASESLVNVMSAGIVGGALGGIGTAIGIRNQKLRIEQYKIRKNAIQEVNNVLTDTDKELDANGMLKQEDIINLPAIVRRSMNFSPMNRLLNSPFGISKWFANRMYEHGYTTVKNTEGESTGAAVERMIKGDKQAYHAVMLDYQNIYFDMVGIKAGPFKGLRAKINDSAMNKESFDSAVSLVLTTEKPHPVEHVNRAAKLLRESIFDPIRDELIKENMLPEDVMVENAANYFMIVFNKHKIIDQGGKDARGTGTFPQALYDGFKAIQDKIAVFKQSPTYTQISQSIAENKEKLKGIPKEERQRIDKQVSLANKNINTLERLKTQKPKDLIADINKKIKEKTKAINDLKLKSQSAQDEYKTQLDNEIISFKSEIENYKKQSTEIKSRLGKFESKMRSLKERRVILQERIKNKKPETKTFLSIQDELDKLPSVMQEVQKNINAVKDELAKVSTNKSKASADIKRLQGMKKLDSKESLKLKEQIKKIESDIKEIEKDKTVSPEEIKKLEKKIQVERDKIKELEKKKVLPEKEKAKLQDAIAELQERLIKEAPKGSINKKTGELFDVVDDETLWSHVEQTVDNILGDTKGKLLNPLMNRMKGLEAKPMQARVIQIPQVDLRDWHVTDASKVAEMYISATLPVLKLTQFAKSIGAEDIAGLRKMLAENLKKEYDTQSKGKTGKEAQKLRSVLDKNINDINDTLDLLMGVYGDGPNIMNNQARKYYKAFLAWNSIRLLGYMTLSSIPDIGIQVFTHGPYRLIHDGLVQSFSEARKIAKRDLRAIGYGIETELGSRIASYAEHKGLSTNPTPFSKAFDSIVQGFGNASLMNQWNTWMQTMAGHVGINRTLEVIHKVVNGEKVSKKEIERVVKLGIDKKYFDTIYNFTKNNIDESGAYYADWQNWDIKTATDRDALKQFQYAVGKEIEQIAIVPSLGDKPLFGQSPVGKMFLQFKTFLLASTNRILYTGIQRRNDANVYLGLISMLGMGAMSYVVTSLVRGNEPDLSFDNLSREAIDRSGVLGIFGEFVNIGEKGLGLGGVSRYQSRDLAGAMLGPTGGAINEIATVLNHILHSIKDDEDLTTKDAEKIMRLMPYQNLFYLHQLNRMFAKNIASEFGAVDVD